MPLASPISTPYVTPAMLVNMPTGVAWSTIPQLGASASLNNSELVNICQRATATVDGYCNQVLRAEMGTEEIIGPDTRLVMRQNGNAELFLRRWPITEVLAVDWSFASAFPVVWTSIPAGNWFIVDDQYNVYSGATPGASGVGSSSVQIAPGFVNWAYGRDAFRVRATYINGWPHTSLTADTAVGATTLSVGDVTGCGGGASTGVPAGTDFMWIYDGANTEMVQVGQPTSGTPINLGNGGTFYVGPGSVPCSPLQYSHPPGTVVSALPADVIWAAALFAAAQTLTRGTTATTVQGRAGTSSSSKDMDELMAEGEVLLEPYRRIF